MTRTFVVVGAGLAGAKAAETLRSEGFDGRIVLVGDERERPYERPSLSKTYLQGDELPTYVHDEGFYERERIELLTDAQVVAVDTPTRTVHFDHGDEMRYDRLLLTTGAEPVQLDVPGADLDGVHHLRTRTDADTLRDALDGATDAVVVGAGFLGSEVAASLRQLGRRVTLVGRGNVPLERALGAEVGAVYRNLHADHGVALHLRSAVAAVLGTGRVERVVLTDGTILPADLVVVGIGARPRDRLAADAGLVVENGVVVDTHLRSSDPAIFAAGDVAAAFHPMLDARIRVEHWANALHQGPAAARNMLGIATVYDRVPYFFSDQFELGMEFWGHTARANRVVFRGDPDAGEFVAFWLAGRRVVAGMAVNVWGLGDAVGRLIRERVRVDPDVLADRQSPLDALAA